MTKCRWLFEYGAVRLPEALFMVFLLDSKGAKACKSCRSRQELSNEYLLFTYKNRRRYSRERVSQILEVIQFISSLTSLESPCVGLRVELIRSIMSRIMPLLLRFWRHVQSSHTEYQHRVSNEGDVLRNGCDAFCSYFIQPFVVVRFSQTTLHRPRRQTIDHTFSSNEHRSKIVAA